MMGKHALPRFPRPGGWLLFCLVSVALVAAWCSIAMGDGEPAAWWGSSLYPVDSDSIRMVSERVQIYLSPTTALVKASFNFKNDGEACEQVVAFPAGGQRTSGARDFRAWVDGREVEVGKQPDGLSGDMLFYWTVPFPTGGRRTVQVRYETGRDTSEGDPEDARFSYVLTTGRRWKGPIGTAEIVLYLVDMGHHQIRELAPPGYTKTPTGYRWLLRNIEPTQNVSVRFHPSALKVIAQDGERRNWEYYGYPPLQRGNTVLLSSCMFGWVGSFRPEWDEPTQTVTVRRGPLVIRFRVGRREAFLGDRRITLRTAPQLRDGQAMIPMELAEPLGLQALYTRRTRELALRHNLLNWDVATEPEHESLHLAPRRYLRAEYVADQKRLTSRLQRSVGAARANALFELADISYYLGQWETAEAGYGKVPLLEPRHRWARWWQGKCRQRQERYGEALRLFAEQATWVAGTEPTARRSVALAAWEAVLCVTKYRGWRIPEAEMALAIAAARRGEVVAAGADQEKLRREMVTLFAMAQQYDEMLEVAERLLSSGDVTNPDFRQMLQPLAHIPTWFSGERRHLGYLMADRLRGTDLEEEFLQAVGTAEFDAKDFDKAAQVYERLVQEFPKSENLPQYLERIATATKKLEGLEAFKERCWKLITEYPAAAGLCTEDYWPYASEEQLRWMAENMARPSGGVLLALADLEYWQGDYESALKHYRSYGIGGDLRDTLRVKSTLMSALCQLHLGEVDGARAALEYVSGAYGEGPGDYSQILTEILTHGPESEAAYLAISGCWESYPRWSTAREVLRRGLEKHPQSARLRYALGRTFWWEGEQARPKDEPARELQRSAIEQYESALQMDPGFKTCRLAASEAYCVLAQDEQDPAKKRRYYEQAIAHWKVAATLKPEGVPIGSALPDLLDGARYYLSRQ